MLVLALTYALIALWFAYEWHTAPYGFETDEGWFEGEPGEFVFLHSSRTNP